MIITGRGGASAASEDCKFDGGVGLVYVRIEREFNALIV